MFIRIARDRRCNATPTLTLQYQDHEPLSQEDEVTSGPPWRGSFFPYNPRLARGMQHFPRIAAPYNPIRVPYRGGRYRGDNFATFLQDHDPPFDLESLQRHELGQHTQEAVTRILQAWLYFGLLSEALQLDVVEEDFTEGHGEDKFITTERLRDYIHQWKAAHENAKLDPSKLAERKRRTIEALKISYEAWKGFANFTAIVGSEIQLSIQLLGCAIEHAVTSVYEGKAGLDMDTWIMPTDAPWRQTSSPFIEKRMLEMGWCPSVIRQLGHPFKLSLLTFVSLLKPSFNIDPAVHVNMKCEYGDIACRWKNIDEANYETQHVDGCKCPDRDPRAFLHVDEGDLRKILEEGGIPIVYLDAPGDGPGDPPPRLRVVKYEYELQYTAISHVWADGLGNAKSNALPLCQVQRILGFLAKSNDSWMPISKIPPTQYYDSVWKKDVLADKSLYLTPDETAEKLNAAPIYIWMDTLCVPPRPEDRDLRKAAIKSMRSVYNRANRVFVLDADLLATPGTRKTLSDQEFLARISASSWVRRYWTLQEALLAKNLLIQFAEEPIRIIDPHDQTENFRLHFYDNEVGFDADNTDFSMRMSAEHRQYYQRVQSIWMSLEGRTTSKPPDELICLATLLDMDLGKLLEVDEKARMAQLWKMYTEFPVGALCRPAEKLEDPAIPWAFANISDCATLVAPTNVAATQRDGRLYFAHHGFIVRERLRHTPASIIAVKIGEDVYLIRQNLRNGNKPWHGIEFTSPSARFAIVLAQNRPSSFDACVSALIQITAGDADGLQDGKVLKGQYLRTVSIVKKGSQYDITPSSQSTETENNDRETLYSGAWLRSEQQWEVRGGDD